jgi:hypothetical protein
VRHIFVPEIKKLFFGKLPVLAFWPLLINRLVSPVLVGLSLYVRSYYITNCNAIEHAAYALLGVATVTTQWIFCIRTIAIRRGGSILEGFLWLNVVGSLALWWSWAFSQGVNATPVDPYHPYDSVCNAVYGTHNWHQAIWIHSLCFDTMIIALTVTSVLIGLLNSLSADNLPGAHHKPDAVNRTVNASLLKRLQNMSATSRQFYWDALLYFTISFAFSLAQLVWFVSHAHDIYGALVIPIQVWVNTAVGPRVVKNLKAANQRSLVTYASSQSGRHGLPLNPLSSPKPTHQDTVTAGSLNPAPPAAGTDTARDVTIVSSVASTDKIERKYGGDEHA